MELINCFTENGSLVATKLFLKRHNIIPSCFTLTFNEEDSVRDLEKISDELLKEVIPDFENVQRIINKYTSVENLQRDEPFSPKICLSRSSSGICVISKYQIYYIDSESISVRYYDRELEDIQKELQEIWNKLPAKKPESKEAVANLVAYSDGTYYTIESKIKKVDISIEENYNDDFIEVYKDITRFIECRESGLVLLYGLPGTGKSNFLRYLCNRYPKDYIIVPTSLISRLGDPDFVSFMMDNANSVFILEDCEQVLVDRGVNMFNGAISNILNMSDGLLSDIMNIKFICTFNADVKTIDQALLRKGRCYAKYEFKELSEDKVKALNDKYNLGIKEIKPMTLAEIYNANQTEYSEGKTQKIGF